MSDDPTLRSIMASAAMQDLSPKERERLIMLAGDKVKDERLHFETLTAITRRAAILRICSGALTKTTWMIARPKAGSAEPTPNLMCKRWFVSEPLARPTSK